ncbi:hypothetical protein [Mariniphaga sp.]|uniref:hypothetical protein n=1 Tax=Mariniphaga sp. TaxID=1954475 RepID=UPI003566EB1E
MPLNSNSTEQKTDFRETMAELNNEQLIEVLKKRKLYQEAAAKQAIHEAMERGIIHSEEDLLGPEFREKKLRRQLFPEIENEKIRNKIRRSISRGLFLAGSLPAILGVIRLTRGNQAEGILLLVFTVVWLGASVWLFRMFSRIAFNTLAGLGLLSLVYALKQLFFPPGYSVMDKFIVVMLYLLIAYGLIYIKRLNR